MRYDIIATGSSGNAVLINGEILIDCGVPYRQLKPYIKGLKLVLLTHQHTDHFKPSTVWALADERPTLRWGCGKWMLDRLLDCDVDPRRIDLLHICNTYQYPFATVRPELLLHNVQNYGYHIMIGAEKLFYATDTGTLDGIQAKDYDLYLIEANHTRAELEARIAAKQAAGEFAYEYAAAQNHLSQEQAMEFLAENAGANSRYQFLHQHIDKKENKNVRKDAGRTDL